MLRSHTYLGAVHWRRCRMAFRHSFTTLVPSKTDLGQSLALQHGEGRHARRWVAVFGLVTGGVIEVEIWSLERVDPESDKEWRFHGIVAKGSEAQTPPDPVRTGARVRGLIKTEKRSGWLEEEPLIYLVVGAPSIDRIMEEMRPSAADNPDFTWPFTLRHPKDRLLEFQVDVVVRGAYRVICSSWVLHGFIGRSDRASLRERSPVMIAHRSTGEDRRFQMGHLIESPVRAPRNLHEFFPHLQTQE